MLQSPGERVRSRLRLGRRERALARLGRLKHVLRPVELAAALRLLPGRQVTKLEAALMSTRTPFPADPSTERLPAIYEAYFRVKGAPEAIEDPACIAAFSIREALIRAEAIAGNGHEVVSLRLSADAVFLARTAEEAVA